ncbi:MFS transporter [Dactylosporangium sp. NPDC051541]|uniref:MFS transporter n=1 Tax=Dactylosporangium sp. NPDC051541 TaxID=3363977 RepID=UPI0037A4347D
MHRAALGTAVVFTASGAVVGAWISRIPAVVETLELTTGELGRALLALGIGSLISMPVTGYACRRLGSRTWVAATALVSAAALTACGLATSVWTLSAALFVLGLSYGSWDVAMNVQGAYVDRQAAREWMPRYHACWSLGSIAGTAAGAAAARFGTAVAPHLAIAALVSLTAAWTGLLSYLDERTTPGVPQTTSAPSRRPTRAILTIGLITFCATVAEGAAGDWLALYLNTARDFSQSAAALAYTVFATAMTAGRFLGSTAVAYLGRATAVRGAAVLGLAGVTTTVLSPWPALTYTGSLLWAVGICLVFPAAVSAAAETPNPAEAIAAVTAIGYGSILVGPPLIGALADRTGLAPALLLLAVLPTAIFALAPVLRPQPHPAQTPTPTAGPGL